MSFARWDAGGQYSPLSGFRRIEGPAGGGGSFLYEKTAMEEQSRLYHAWAGSSPGEGANDG